MKNGGMTFSLNLTIIQHKTGIEIQTEILKREGKSQEDIDKLEKVSIGDWIDLRCSETMELKKGQHYYVPLGVAM